MNMIYLHEIRELAMENPNGFSVEIPSLAPITSGIIVAYEATQNSFGDEGMAHAVSHALQHDGVLGGWLNRDNGYYYFDSCKVYTNREEAMAFGREQKQIAIFDIDDLRVIKL